MASTRIASGPFPLRSDYPRREWVRALGLCLLFTVVGTPMSGYAAYLVKDLLRIVSVWDRGVPAESEVSYDGKVSTHSLILKDYDLKVTFSAGATHPTVDCDFVRFFTGPDEGDPIEVHYLADDPTQAVISWQREGLVHGAVWAILAAALGVTMLAGTIYTIVSTRKTVALVLELARGGDLHMVAVEEAKVGGTAQAPELNVAFRTPSGDVAKQKFMTKRAAPLFTNDGQGALALVSMDGRRAHLLHHDGYPLAEVPGLDEAGS